MVDKHGRQVSASDTPKYWLSLPFEILPFSSRPSFRFKIFFLFLFLPADLISCNFRRMFFFPTVGVFYFERGISIPAVYNIPFVDVIIELFFNKRCASWWLRINPVSMTTSFFENLKKKGKEFRVRNKSRERMSLSSNILTPFWLRKVAGLAHLISCHFHPDSVEHRRKTWQPCL
jgi:hypothetical protein